VPLHFSHPLCAGSYGATPATVDDGSEYEDDDEDGEDDEDDDEWPLFGTMFFLSLFGALMSKGRRIIYPWY
jgi:hypothetical protein